MHARQATVSKLEAGGPATQLRTLIDALAALDLELVIRPRTKSSAKGIEDLF
jgi:HTH-type transcriptional regulator/antitoxin HipB